MRVASLWTFAEAPASRMPMHREDVWVYGWVYSSCSLDIYEVKMGENEGYWRNGAMEREGKGGALAQGLILALAV